MPADPPTVRTAAPTRPGDTIPGRRTLRVIAVLDDDADQPRALVVEPLSQITLSCERRVMAA